MRRVCVLALRQEACDVLDCEQTALNFAVVDEGSLAIPIVNATAAVFQMGTQYLDAAQTAQHVAAVEDGLLPVHAHIQLALRHGHGPAQNLVGQLGVGNGDLQQVLVHVEVPVVYLDARLLVMIVVVGE